MINLRNVLCQVRLELGGRRQHHKQRLGCGQAYVPAMPRDADYNDVNDNDSVVADDDGEWRVVNDVIIRRYQPPQCT